MARSRGAGRRVAAGPTPSDPDPRPPAAGASPGPTLASATLPRVWQSVGYRPLSDPGFARGLFDFAAVPWPERDPLEVAWGASRDGSLVGAIVGECAGTSLLLHGPVVVVDQDPMEVAAQLVAAAIDHACALGVETVFARPLGLDRVWIRFGFIPTPESALPTALAGRPGSGLYAWRGGTALWTFREHPRE